MTNEPPTNQVLFDLVCKSRLLSPSMKGLLARELFLWGPNAKKQLYSFLTKEQAIRSDAQSIPKEKVTDKGDQE